MTPLPLGEWKPHVCNGAFILLYLEILRCENPAGCEATLCNSCQRGCILSGSVSGGLEFVAPLRGVHAVRAHDEAEVAEATQSLTDEVCCCKGIIEILRWVLLRLVTSNHRQQRRIESNA